MKYYSLKRIKSKKARYNVIFGERSNGKTYAVLVEILEKYGNNKEKGVYLRRFDDQLTPKVVLDMFVDIVRNGVPQKISKGKWNDIVYKNRRWWLAYSENGEIVETDNEPFMYALAINKVETFKSGFSDSTVTTVFFDEFLTRGVTLKNEFIMFQNCLSTIIRNRDNVIIYMVGNTVNKSSPYFIEMGLNNVQKQKQGTIDVYTYGSSGLIVAVEYCADTSSQKKSNVYFAFDSPALKMITTGSWEIGSYPHPDFRVSLSEKIFDDTFILFEENILQLECYYDDEHQFFILVHPFTLDFDYHNKIIYTIEPHSEKEYRCRPSTHSKKDTMVWKLYKDNKWLYSDNSTGEIVRNFVQNLMQ